MVRLGEAGRGDKRTRSARVNGLVVVVVVMVELGPDIYLCSQWRIDWVHRAEAREKGFGFEAQRDCIMRNCAWDEEAAFGVCGAAGSIIFYLKTFRCKRMRLTNPIKD